MKQIKIIIEQTTFAGQDRWQLMSLTNAATVQPGRYRKVACGSSLSVDQVIALCTSENYETTINYIPSK